MNDARQPKSEVPDQFSQQDARSGVVFSRLSGASNYEAVHSKPGASSQVRDSSDTRTIQGRGPVKSLPVGHHLVKGKESFQLSTNDKGKGREEANDQTKEGIHGKKRKDVDMVGKESHSSAVGTQVMAKSTVERATVDAPIHQSLHGNKQEGSGLGLSESVVITSLPEQATKAGKQTGGEVLELGIARVSGELAHASPKSIGAGGKEKEGDKSRREEGQGSEGSNAGAGTGMSPGLKGPVPRGPKRHRVPHKWTPRAQKKLLLENTSDGKGATATTTKAAMPLPGLVVPDAFPVLGDTTNKMRKQKGSSGESLERVEGPGAGSDKEKASSRTALQVSPLGAGVGVGDLTTTTTTTWSQIASRKPPGKGLEKRGNDKEEEKLKEG